MTRRTKCNLGDCARQLAHAGECDSGMPAPVDSEHSYLDQSLNLTSAVLDIMEMTRTADPDENPMAARIYQTASEAMGKWGIPF